jgi:hypothetical protein
MEVASRCVFTLWNPYTSALVPESLRIEVEGLPDVIVADSAGGDHRVQLQETLAGGAQSVRFNLPWTPEESSVDTHSWLPGRVYSWAAIENTGALSDGNEMVFHRPDATPLNLGGQGIVRQTSVHHHVLPPGSIEPLTRSCRSEVPSTIRVRVLRASDETELATYSFTLEPFGPTTAIKVADKYLDFAIIRRLPETDELPTGVTEKWLTAAGRDPRNPAFPADGFIGGANGDDPAVYGGDGVTTFAVRNAQRLLDRGSDGISYNEDAPVFELPRGPLLSVGQLQHLQLPGARPFTIGNPWMGELALKEITAAQVFDRFFFSGVTDSVVAAASATGNLILPNVLLKPLRKSDGTKVTMEDVRPTPVVEPEPTEPPVTPPPVEDTPVEPVDPAIAERIAATRTSRHFLQGGAFNLNSTNARAWAAVLRNVRFPAPQSFTFLDASTTTGTAEDTAIGSVQSDDAQFFRFSQSAQETYKADPGMADNDPDVPSVARTELFRRGMRTLSAAEVKQLAEKVAEFVGLKHGASDAAGGPFRSLEEFLAPSALFAGVDADGNPLAPRSLLEAAIADAGINAAIPEFSSQWLTQADVMTALAPILFPRSDTFVIRTYGEAVNPATSAVEGRAWAEAIVQRLPDYFVPSMPPETLGSAFEPVPNPDDPEAPPTSTSAQDLNKLYGRRFKVISFRWLTRADI